MRPAPESSTRLRGAYQAVRRLSLWALRTWLDSWAGIGRIAVGMAHQGFDLQLTRYDERGWRAMFYTGMERSPTKRSNPAAAILAGSRTREVATGRTAMSWSSRALPHRRWQLPS